MSQDIKILADKANREHHLVTSSSKDLILHARNCGKILTEIKEEIPHGEYENYLKNNFNGSYEIALRYTKIYNQSFYNE